MEYRKMVLMNLFAGQQWRNRHGGQTYGHGERGGEGEMNGESNTEAYITTCKIDSQREFAVWLRKLKQGFCINLEEWGGEGGGREIQKEGICVYLWLSHVEVWQKTTKLCIAVNLQLRYKLIHKKIQYIIANKRQHLTKHCMDLTKHCVGFREKMVS